MESCLSSKYFESVRIPSKHQTLFPIHPRKCVENHRSKGLSAEDGKRMSKKFEEIYSFLQRLEGPDGTIGRENIVRMLTVNKAMKRTTLKRIQLAIEMNDALIVGKHSTVVLLSSKPLHCLDFGFLEMKKNTFTKTFTF